MIASLLDVAILEGLADALTAAAGFANPRGRFLTRSWFASALTADGPTRTLVASRNGKPVVGLPVIRLPFGLRMVPGNYWPFRSFPVAAELCDEDMTAFLRTPAIRRALGPVWRLGPIYADDPALIALKRAAKASGWALVERRVATSFVLDMAALKAEGQWPRGSTLRKNRFHEKHLAAHGVLEWRFISGGDWTPRIFDDLAAIEARSWLRDEPLSDAKFMAPANRQFWERLAADPEQAARMWAALLYIDGAPAAFSFDFNAGETKYAIANSYDERFAKHSPGKCLYYRNLIEAIGQGIALVDWGAGDSGYKQTIGATPGAEIVDCLILRGRLGRFAARLLGPLWARSGRA
jgi:CelD/BcsL family acetyltransferase involved in cellulose biosynthesis